MPVRSPASHATRPATLSVAWPPGGWITSRNEVPSASGRGETSRHPPGPRSASWAIQRVPETATSAGIDTGTRRARRAFSTYASVERVNGVTMPSMRGRYRRIGAPRRASRDVPIMGERLPSSKVDPRPVTRRRRGEAAPVEGPVRGFPPRPLLWESERVGPWRNWQTRRT